MLQEITLCFSFDHLHKRRRATEHVHDGLITIALAKALNRNLEKTSWKCTILQCTFLVELVLICLCSRKQRMLQ